MGGSGWSLTVDVLSVGDEFLSNMRGKKRAPRRNEVVLSADGPRAHLALPVQRLLATFTRSLPLRMPPPPLPPRDNLQPPLAASLALNAACPLNVDA